MSIIERSLNPLPYDAEAYRADAHAAGMTEVMQLVVTSRPGAALRRLARTVEEELACIGVVGVSVPITAGMARVIHAKRVREARRAVGS